MLLGIGRPALSNFLNGKAALSQEMARRLERAFEANREYLLNLQAQYDRRDETLRTSIVAGRHAPTLIEIKARRIEEWADTTPARGHPARAVAASCKHDRGEVHPHRFPCRRQCSATRMGWRDRNGDPNSLDTGRTVRLGIRLRQTSRTESE